MGLGGTLPPGGEQGNRHRRPDLYSQPLHMEPGKKATQLWVGTPGFSCHLVRRYWDGKLSGKLPGTF